MKRGENPPRFGGGSNQTSDVFQASFSRKSTSSFNPNKELADQPSISNEEYQMKSNENNNANAQMSPDEELAALRRQNDDLRAVVDRLSAGKPAAEQSVPQEESSVLGTIGKAAMWTLGVGVVAAGAVFGYQYFSGKEDAVADALAGAAGAVA